MLTLTEKKTINYNQWTVNLIPIYDNADKDYILRVEYTANYTGGTGVIYEEPHGIHVCVDSYIPHGLRQRLENTGSRYINQLRKHEKVGQHNVYRKE